jgi:hypothetical protein
MTWIKVKWLLLKNNFKLTAHCFFAVDVFVFPFLIPNFLFLIPYSFFF